VGALGMESRGSRCCGKASGKRRWHPCPAVDGRGVGPSHAELSSSQLWHPAPRQEERLPMTGAVSIKCGFCQGRGLDPFSIMSHLSTCCICGGMGRNQVKQPYVQCAFCHGTGVYPLSRLTCTACGGIGVSPVEAPHQQCPHCLGTGTDPHSETGFYCLICHGAGAIKADENRRKKGVRLSQ
jgi:DnaJ-class molecular chaperone